MKQVAVPEWTNDAEYQKLVGIVKGEGFLKKTPLHYVIFSIVIFGGLGLSLYFLTLTNNPWLVALIALLAAFPRTWSGYLGHDIAHGAVFSSKEFTEAGTLLIWPLVVGISGKRWQSKHNTHHDHVNCVTCDPDLYFPAFFSQKQWIKKNFIQKFSPDFLVRFQHIYFFLLFPFLIVSFLIETVLYLFSKPFTTDKLIEGIFLATHYIVVYSFVFNALGIVNGLIFFVVHAMATGTMLSLAFAPNHKGQAMYDCTETFNWKHQVIATRNLTPSPVTDFLYGGLNYQIEHHLFPYMSRFNLGKSRKTIRKFCLDSGLPYYETTPLESLQEIYKSLKVNKQLS